MYRCAESLNKNQVLECTHSNKGFNFSVKNSIIEAYKDHCNIVLHVYTLTTQLFSVVSQPMVLVSEIRSYKVHISDHS